MSSMSDASPIIVPDNGIEVAKDVAEIASDVSSTTRAALAFVKKTWVDDPESGTTITAADLNRIEEAISSLDTSVQSLQGSVSRMRRVFTGTKIIELNNTGYGTLFSDSEYRSIVGRSFDQASDFVASMNADTAAQNAPVKGTSYVPGSKTIIFTLDSQRVGSIRVNYVIVAR